MKNIWITLVVFLFWSTYKSQNSFDYSLSLVPVTINGLPGLHSFAHAQHNGKWLVIGGRKDGLHARQPFNSFPETQNNTDIFVIDIASQQFWSASVNALPASIKEQMQSTNMNYTQDGNALYLVGGYGFSATNNDHITFPFLTSIDVPSLINAVIDGTSIQNYFKQISNSVFAVSGGHLKKFNSKFYLVGGHRFDGRYNPMNNPTYVQAYTNEIRMFDIDNAGITLSFSNYSAINDPVHLRRRDYNLLPQIYPNGEEGLLISSGVFQINADLPFLYPVEIKSSGHVPVTTFNQYLSNYHSATAALYNANLNEMYSLFFGGMSQYFYQNGVLVQDNQVPFVKTISMLTRNSTGQLQEYKLATEMPNLKGASAEFFNNENLPNYVSNHIIKLHDITQNSFMIGHIMGGIQSPTQNPFSVNQTNTTSADPTIYEVWLTKNPLSTNEVIDGRNPYEIKVSPNPFSDEFSVAFSLDHSTTVSYFITDFSGKIVIQENDKNFSSGDKKINIKIEKNRSPSFLLTVVFDNKYYVTKKLIVK